MTFCQADWGQHERRREDDERSGTHRSPPNQIPSAQSEGGVTGWRVLKRGKKKVPYIWWRERSGVQYARDRKRQKRKENRMKAKKNDDRPKTRSESEILHRGNSTTNRSVWLNYYISLLGINFLLCLHVDKYIQHCIIYFSHHQRSFCSSVPIWILNRRLNIYKLMKY